MNNSVLRTMNTNEASKKNQNLEIILVSKHLSSGMKPGRVSRSFNNFMSSITL